MPADIPLVGPIVNKIFGSRNERLVRRYTDRVNQINALEPEFSTCTDTEIRAKTDELRERVTQGQKAEDIFAEAFAVAREAMDRSVGLRNMFDPKLREEFPLDQLSDDMRSLYERTHDANPEGCWR